RDHRLLSVRLYPCIFFQASGIPSSNDAVHGVPLGIGGDEYWPEKAAPSRCSRYCSIIRASCVSRLLTHLPSQSSRCELPTVASSTESRSSTASAWMGNFPAGNGSFRNQLLGIGPLLLGLPVSPPSQPCRVIAICPTSFGTIVAVRLWRPMLFRKYRPGGPGLSHGFEPMQLSDRSFGSSLFPLARNS